MIRTPFHDEIRMITPNLVVGRWVTEWSSEDFLKPYYNDFKRVLNIPISLNVEPGFQRLLHMFPNHRNKITKRIWTWLLRC